MLDAAGVLSALWPRGISTTNRNFVGRIASPERFWAEIGMTEEILKES